MMTSEHALNSWLDLRVLSPPRPQLPDSAPLLYFKTADRPADMTGPFHKTPDNFVVNKLLLR